MRGVFDNPQQGDVFELTLPDGSTRRVRYEGFGPWMKSIWRDDATGELLPDLPAHKSSRKVD